MLFFYVLILFVLCTLVKASDKSNAPMLYYYGLEESERGLSRCAERQACAALSRRYWRAAALVRLCRCPRRAACDSPAPPERSLPLNNRAQLQFCGLITDWPKCSSNDTALSVTPYTLMNPDELEEKHHKNIQLTPPTITFNCRCREPNYWKLLPTEDNNKRVYRCSSLPLCKTGEYCGNVNEDLYALYQSCLCPKHHICVYEGGLPNTHVSELLYEGRGWKAYCRRIGEDYSYEEY